MAKQPTYKMNHISASKCNTKLSIATYRFKRNNNSSQAYVDLFLLRYKSIYRVQ